MYPRRRKNETRTGEISESVVIRKQAKKKKLHILTRCMNDYWAI